MSIIKIILSARSLMYTTEVGVREFDIAMISLFITDTILSIASESIEVLLSILTTLFDVPGVVMLVEYLRAHTHPI